MTADIHALSGAYALDAVDPQERAEFERHLAGCPSCQAEVDSLREAGAALAELSTQTPPAHLREEVLSGARQIRPLPPKVLPIGQKRGWRRAGVLLAAAAVALGLVLVAYPRLNSQSGDRLAAVAAIQHAPDASATEQKLANGASVIWYRSASLDRTAVVVKNMPAPASGRVYELWLQNSAAQMVPAGFLPTGGSASAVLKSSTPDAKGAGITVEPAGGSPSPTSLPLSVVAFKAT